MGSSVLNAGIENPGRTLRLSMIKPRYLNTTNKPRSIITADMKTSRAFHVPL